MRWSIAEVAGMTGLTSRTLRHFHAIGLLTPAHVGHGGRRYYEQPQLLRLQQIMLLRELGLRLGTIAEVLAERSDVDTVAALRRHHAWLLREQERLRRLARTVETTITTMESGEDMASETLFDGFAHDPYEAEARERYGDDAVDAAKARVAALTGDDALKARTGYDQVHEGLRPLWHAGVAVEDARVQALIALHYEVTSLFWTPNAEAYVGLAQTYGDDERFRATIGGGDDALVTYLRHAMVVYAGRHLS